MPGLRQVLGSLLGARCRACGAVLRAAHPLDICPDCARRLAPREGGYCPLCGEMTPDPALPPILCGRCRLDPPPWDGLAFYAAYDDLLRELLSGFKFNARLGRAGLLRDLVRAAHARHGAEWPRPELVLPVPLHDARLAERGFNQSLELARGLARDLEAPLEPRGLIRRQPTRPQTGLSAAERKGNVKDAFEADRDLVGGRIVLLVDDVMTTGGTLRECVRTLSRAGVSSVWVLVAARTGGQF